MTLLPFGVFGSILAVVLATQGLRRWLARREVEVDYEREYRDPPILGIMPNLPPS